MRRLFENQILTIIIIIIKIRWIIYKYYVKQNDIFSPSI